MIDDGLHCNDGDWVESLTALAEHADGRLQILAWSARPANQSSAAAAAL